MDDRPERGSAYWDERHAAREPIESAEPNPALVAEAASLPPGRSLDLGTGDGTTAVWLAARGWRSTGVDFSAVALDRARELAERSGVEVSWIRADLLEFRPAVGAFDLVTLFYLHLPADQRRMVLARAAAAVAPRGVLLVVGHDRTNLTDGVSGPQHPEVLYTPEEIAADLPGLTIDRAEVVRQAPPGERGLIDAVVRARRIT